MNIGILTLRNKFTRGSNIWYPLIKWEKNFSKSDGITFNYFKTHNDRRILDEDVVIIDSRYCWQLIELDQKFENLDFIKGFISKVKQKNKVVLFFDNSDSTEGRYFELIDYVDTYVKKQVLKDRNKYTSKDGINIYSNNIEEIEIGNESEKNENFSYIPCPDNQLNKIKLGWNIGMEDYRYFPFSQYYPVSTTGLLNSIYMSPNFNTEYFNNTYISSFRGTINNNDENYSYQRNKVIELFKQLNSDEFITGGKISKRKYLAELRKSKICVSPFGWGEVCFRDFESIICGCVLLKPDMSHVDTYPDIYDKDKTYKPLKWDMSDLKEELENIINNYDDHIELIEQAQDKYEQAILNYSEFRNRFLSLLP